MKVNELLEMLSEIMGIKKEIVFENFEINGHYVRTPYSYLPPVGKKLTLPIHVDIGQGLLQIIEEINQELGNMKFVRFNKDGKEFFGRLSKEDNIFYLDTPPWKGGKKGNWKVCQYS